MVRDCDLDASSLDFERGLGTYLVLPLGITKVAIRKRVSDAPTVSVMPLDVGSDFRLTSLWYRQDIRLISAIACVDTPERRIGLN